VHPVDVAAQRVDFAVMSDEAVRMGAVPRREGVGAVAFIAGLSPKGREEIAAIPNSIRAAGDRIADLNVAFAKRLNEVSASGDLRAIDTIIADEINADRYTVVFGKIVNESTVPNEAERNFIEKRLLSGGENIPRLSDEEPGAGGAMATFSDEHTEKENLIAAARSHAGRTAKRNIRLGSVPLTPDAVRSLAAGQLHQAITSEVQKIRAGFHEESHAMQ
jgi:hypothetical protein